VVVTPRHLVAVDVSARALMVARGAVLRGAVAAGHTVTAIAARDRSMADLPVPDLEQRFADAGVRLIWWNLDRQGTSVLADLAALVQLLRELRSIRPDLVLCYSAKSVIYGSIAAQIARVPARYSTITGLGYLFSPSTRLVSMLKQCARGMLGISLRANRKVFFQNPDDRALFLEAGLIRSLDDGVLVSGSGVDVRRFTPQPLPDGPLTFLMVARLQREKGVLDYLEAADRVRREQPDVVFALLGPFDDHPAAMTPAELQRWVDRGVVEYWGATSDVRPYLARCHAFVLPSYREGTPVSSLEAMATARAIVTTDVPGCRETVVQGVNGLLSPVADPDALADSCRRLIAEPQLLESFGRESRKMAEEKFAADQVAGVMLKTMGLVS
jgi:glycosyltransferase involved in cell wall biosynthesis